MILGHSYSTKIYSYLFSKRVIFRVKNDEIHTHKKIIPYIHYMEVNNDLSDLIEKYKYLERDPDIYDRIVENCNKLVIDEISQQKLQYKFSK